MNNGFLITIRSQPKHGLLYAAAKSHGSIKAMAEAMGIAASIVSQWVNLKSYPRSLWSQRATDAHWAPRIRKAIENELSRPAEEVWPLEVREFIDKTRHLKTLIFEQTKEVPLPRLTAAMTKQLTVEGEAERAANIEESKEAIARVLKTLTYREREILKLRFGLNGGPTYTVKEVGHIFGVTRGRILQIEAKAIYKLQQPSRSQELIGLID